MFSVRIKPKLLVVFLCVLSPFAIAEMSAEQAAIVEGNKRTQALVAEQKIEAALRNAQSTHELSARTLGADNLNTAILAGEYARLLGVTGDKRRAYSLYVQAVDIFEKVYGEKTIKAVPSMLGMGEFAATRDQPWLVKRALESQRTGDPDDRLTYADAAIYAGEYLARNSANRDYAIEVLTEALNIYEEEHGENSAKVIPSLMLLGNASTNPGQASKAKSYYRRALAIADKELTEGHQATLFREAGTALLRYSGSRDAKRYLVRGHKMSVDVFGEDDSRTALAALALARYHMADKKLRSAEPLLKQALEVVEKNENYRNHELVVLSLLVSLNESQGRRDEATPYCQAIGAISPWTNTQDYKPIFKKAPKYPRGALRARSEGYVTVEYTVDEYGFVQEPHVVEREGHESFDDVSLEAADGFRYAPAYVDGKAVPTKGVRNKFSFTLR